MDDETVDLTERLERANRIYEAAFRKWIEQRKNHPGPTRALVDSALRDYIDGAEETARFLADDGIHV